MKGLSSSIRVYGYTDYYGIIAQSHIRIFHSYAAVKLEKEYLSTVSAITGGVTHDRGADNGIATIGCTARFGPDEGAAFCKLAKGTGFITEKLLPVTKQGKNTLHIKRMHTFVDNVKAEYRLHKTIYAQLLWKEKELKRLLVLLLILEYSLKGLTNTF
uniref:Uncharacterized protein n=1 Tax=Glossina pallidipes TaxID=7398 RepID=A0A1B0AEC9_GLOPL